MGTRLLLHLTNQDFTHTVNMIYSRLFAVAATLSGFAAAQSNFTTCCDVVPDTVDAPTRASWCRAQMNTCPLLCPNGNTAVNTCDNQALTYECECGGGATTPNVTDFAQTLPSLQCDEWRAQCTAARPNDLAGQTFCQSFICGTRNATEFFQSSGGASSTASESAAAATSSAAAVALKVAGEYGVAVVGLGMAAVFGFAL